MKTIGQTDNRTQRQQNTKTTEHKDNRTERHQDRKTTELCGQVGHMA